MKVLVAGASGLAGSAIAEASMNRGYETIQVTRQNVDLRNFAETVNLIGQHKPDVVISAAAKVGGIVANNDFPVEYMLENLQIQNNVISASHSARVNKVVFLGSSCIYPRNSAQPIKEEYLMTGELEPTNSAYAVAKIAGIELINSYRKEYSHKWVSLMPTNLYGPRDNFNLKSSHVLPALIRKFLEAKENRFESVTLWGTGKPRREFLYIDDFAEAVMVVAEKYDQKLHLNVGTGVDISIKDLAGTIAKIVGFEGQILWDTYKPDGTPRKVLDISRIKELGWEPIVDLASGIQKTVDWFIGARIANEVRL
jgi:GDP-L-fucose synthase